MKKLIVILVAVLLTTAAISESTQAKKNVLCDDTKTMYNELVNGEYAERPVWGGKDEKSNYGLLINEETGTWTFIQFDKEIACILGVGESSRILNSGKRV